MVNRLNLHIDESGSQDFSEGRYIVAVVLHDHSANIADPIDRYECRLSIAGLPNIPFHGKDLLHGNQDYAAVSPGDRKRLLAQFARFVRELPFSFFVLRYAFLTPAIERNSRRGLGVILPCSFLIACLIFSCSM